MKFFKNLKRKRTESIENAQTVRTVRGGGFSAVKGKIKLASLLAAFACCVTALILGITGLVGGIQVADAATSKKDCDYIILEDGTTGVQGKLYKNGLAALYRRLTGNSTCYTYSAFSSALTDHKQQPEGAYAEYQMYTSFDYRYQNNDQNLKIRFGGVDWLLGAVSRANRTTDGKLGDGNHIVATLVLADTNITGMSDWWTYAYHENGKVANYSYPCGMYGTSKVRRYLADSGYYSSNGSSVTEYTNDSNTAGGFVKFSKTYRKYLVQPKYVPWQEQQSGKAVGDGCFYTNEGYSKTTTWVGSGNFDLRNKTYYDAWKDDYIWLPSASEMGGRENDAKNKSSDKNYTYAKSIFRTDRNFRAASNDYWLRTQGCNGAYTSAKFIKKATFTSKGVITATYSQQKTCTNSAYLRPAIHLDLTELNARTSSTTNEPTRPYWSSYNGMNKVNDQLLYASYTGATQTGVVSYKSAYVTAPNGTNSHSVNRVSYYGDTWTYNTISGYWYDDGTNYKELTIKMYKAVLQLSTDSRTFKQDGTGKAPTITSISARSSSYAGVSNTIPAGSSCLPGLDNFTITYYGTKANGTAWPSGSGRTTNKPTEAGSYHMVLWIDEYDRYWDGNSWIYYEDSFAFFDSRTDPDSNIGGIDMSYEIIYGDVSPTITTPTLTYNGQSQNLISSVTPNTQTTATVTYSTTSSTSGFSSSIPTRITAGSYTVWIKITASYYNTYTTSKTVTISKKNISDSDIRWSSIDSYAYTGSAKTPTPIVTHIAAIVSGAAVMGEVNSSSTTDFEYEYSNNTKAGAASVKVTAKSTSTNYTGSKSFSFTISKGSVTVPYWWSSQGTGVSKTDETHATATYSGAQTYAEVNARNNNVINWSVNSTHISWSTSSDRMYFTNAGSYTITATLKDTSNYRWADSSTNTSAYRYLYLTVSKKSISSGVTVSTITSYTYSGSANKPEPTITAVGSNSVTTTTDEFTYTYETNINAGTNTAKVTITAKTSSTNFTGSTSRTFTINKQTIAAVYWLDSQDDGITKNGTTLTTTFNNTKRSFKAYEASNAPGTYNSSGNIDGNSSSYSNATRTMYATNAGTYTITWRLNSTANQMWSTGNSNDIVLTIKVNKVSVSTYSQANNKTYTGNPVTFMPSSIGFASTVENAPTMDQLIYCTYSGTANDGTTYSSSTTAPTKAGTYTAYRHINSAYANNYSVNTSTTYTIGRAYVTVTWDTKTLGATGSPLAPTFTLSFASTVATSARPAVSNFTCSGTGTTPGTYTRKAVLATSYAYNFQINGNNTSVDNSSFTNTHCTRNFNIGEVIVEMPYWLEMSGYTLTGDRLTAIADYKNEQLTFKAYESDAVTPDYTCVVDGYEVASGTRTIKVTNAGTYTFTYHISDDPAMHWTDGTNGDIVLTIVVNKVEVTALYSGGYANLIYNGQQQSAYATGFDLSWPVTNSPDISSLITATYTGKTASGASYNSATKPTDAGTYTVTWKVSDDYKTNYRHASGENNVWTRDFTIAQRNLSDSAVSFSTIVPYTYNGTAQTPQPLVNAINDYAVNSPLTAFTYKYANNVNAGVATVTVEGAEKSNYTGSKAITFIINKELITDVVWDREVFLYNGKVQNPVITTVITQNGLSATVAPVSMFEIYGGQKNAGDYVATAALKAGYAENFTTSATDAFITEFKQAYTIEKAYMQLNFASTTLTYNGIEQLPDFTLTTNSGVDEKSKFAIDVLVHEGSHFVNGTAIDVGSYTIHVSMVGDLCDNYYKQVNGQEVEDGNWTTDFEIVPCKLTAVWTETEFDYNGNKQGTTVDRFEGLPENGSDPFIHIEVTYYAGSVALADTPVHAGEYTVQVAIADNNYRLVDADDAEVQTVSKGFKINSVSFDENGGVINWENLDEIIFTGLPQGLTVDGYTTGVFTGDRSRALNLQIKYAEVDEEGEAGEFTIRAFTNVGKYVARITESYGDYTFEDVPFEILKRKVTIEWKGDEKSRRDGDTILWLYDGERHAPQYSVKFEGNAYIYRDGVRVTNLEIMHGSVVAGMGTITATLVDNGYNSNFELIEESATQKVQVERFRATTVDWYEDGSTRPLTEIQLESLHYETSKIYGDQGPRLKAVAKTNFVTDSGVITIEIPLDVSYPTAVNGYWEVGETRHKAVATFKEEDASSCEFSDGLLRGDDAEGEERQVYVTFVVTDNRKEQEKLTITWVIEVSGEEVELTEIGAFDYTEGYGWQNGVFTFLYDGTARYPYPVAMGEYNNRVELTVGGTENCINSGTGRMVYIVPEMGYEIAEEDSEYRFNIVPRPVKVAWIGESTLMFGEDVNKYIEVEADEEESTCDIASGDRLVITFDSPNVGKRTATALVYRDGVLSENYILTNNTKQVTITRRPISVELIDWSKSLENGASEATDSLGHKYYVFMNDSKVHVPAAELIVKIGGEEKTVKLIVMGEQSETGSYTAYAILDYGDAYSMNFLLVVDETSAELTETVASQRYDIAKMAIEEIIWTAAEGAEETAEITYEYDGKEHMPYAVGVAADGTRVVLDVWGAQTNAGEYTARVSGDYSFAEDAKVTVEFSVLPKKVSVEWLGFNANGEIHVTYNGNEQRPNVKVGGGLTADDYYVTGFVNAGTYTANIVFTNTNYALDDSENVNAGSCEFTIDRRAINVSWTGAGNHVPVNAEAGVMYFEYNGETRGPVASGSYSGISFGEDKTNRIIVTGKAVNVGSYTATATLDYSVAENVNYTLVNATKRFEITPYAITVIWTGNETADGAFEWEYDGNAYNPTAKYKLWNSGEDEWIIPEKINGAKSDVGEYIASIDLPANCAFAVIDGKNSGEQSFRITKKKITKINWYDAADGNLITDITDFTFEYNGKTQLPVAYADGTGEELMVTGARMNAGTGYTATAMLKDAGNYELSANANTTYTFGISEKAVELNWIDASDKGEFTWTYTGDIICPTAEFTDVDGNKVPVTVTGSNVKVGKYLATAHDTFINYYFVDEEGNELVPTQMFSIEALSLGDDFKWLANGGEEGENGTYTFEYDGKAHQPTAQCTVEGKTIIFSYTMSTESGHVSAIVNAGTYTITVKSSDGNYTIPENKDKVTVVITPKEVEVVWGNTKLEYTGDEQVPEAYYVDVNGQTVSLAVTATTAITSGKSTATAAFASGDNVYGNYVLAATEPEEFEVVKKTTGALKWDWTTGKFVPATDDAA